MNLSRLAAVALIILSVSCRPGELPETTDVHSPPAAPSTASAAPSPVQPTLGRLRGQMVMGKDGYGLTACGETMQQIVSFSPEAQAFVDGFLTAGAREFFIDAWAMQEAGGGAQIQRVERVQVEGHGCAEVPGSFIFKAHGNEPFWALAIAGESLSFEQPDAAPVVAPFDGLRQDGDSQQLHAVTADGTMDVTLRRRPCSDGMADATFAWTAEVNFKGQLWKGCAYAGEL